MVIELAEVLIKMIGVLLVSLSMTWGVYWVMRDAAKGIARDVKSALELLKRGEGK